MRWLDTVLRWFGRIAWYLTTDPVPGLGAIRVPDIDPANCLWSERDGWNHAWQSMPNRRLLLPAKFDVYVRRFFSAHGFGPVISVTISLIPPEFAWRIVMEVSLCPVCGEMTSGEDRVGVLLSPIHEAGV